MFKHNAVTHRLRSIPLLCAFLALAACHSGSTPIRQFTIGGTLSGLANGSTVTLNDNQTAGVTVTSNGKFSFPTPERSGSSYDVTVASQPQGETCSVTNGSGTNITTNVSNVSVVCSTKSFIVGGTVSGLSSADQVVLQDNGSDTLTVTANGAFTFKTPIPYDGSYVVTVAGQPTGEVCTVTQSSGAAITANVTNVSVTCSVEAFTVGGTVSGLATGQQLTLKNNGGDTLSLSANGPFTFRTPIAYGGAYSVTVGSQPTGQVCTVSNGSGKNVTYNITDVSVTCSAATFTVGGTVSGLASGTQVTLYDNGADPLTITADGTFTFATPVAYSGSYAVTVATQPTSQTCLVSNGTGSNVSANISGVTVTCYQTQFTTPGNYTWTVPAGVTSINVTAIGGGGGGGGMWGASAGATGGAGAVVKSTLGVTPGQVLMLVVGGGGGAGASGPGSGGFYTCGGGGGGGGSTDVDAATSNPIIAGGGGGGGSCTEQTAGGSAGAAGGAGNAGVTNSTSATTGGSGGSGGIGGAGGTGTMATPGAAGGNGSGGSGGAGGSNGSSYPGGTGGSGSGAGTGGSDVNNDGAGGGGGGYGGGGTGTQGTGGGGGGSVGPAGTTYAPASNGGGSAVQGGNGSIVIKIP